MSESRIESLVRAVTEADKQYYQNDNPTLTDSEYDLAKRELAALDPNNPILSKVSGKASKAFSPVTHNSPMMSLDNAFDQSDIEAFFTRTKADELACELKYDGLAVSLKYDDGRLVGAATRGDGLVGEDVYANALTIQDIPKTIPFNRGVVDIRGEVYMRRSTLSAYNAIALKEGRATLMNPRNAAAGSLRQLDPAITRSRHLSFIAYEVIVDTHFKTHSDKWSFLRDNGFLVSDVLSVVNSAESAYRYIETVASLRHMFDFDIDGAVFKVNDMASRANIQGAQNRAPNWAVAYKFPAVEEATVLKGITVQIGRSGVATPVAELEPVLVGGVMVDRATLHNEDFVLDLNAHLGDTVGVRRAGDVIPEIIFARRSESSDPSPWSFPKNCPSCNSGLVRLIGEAAYRCPNTAHCPAQFLQSLCHSVSRKAFDIDGFGEAVFKKLIDSGKLRNIADLFYLTVDDFKEALGTDSGVLASKLHRAVGATPAKTKPDSFLTALGIPLIGERKAAVLARYYPTIDSLRKATLAELMSIPDYGKETAESVRVFFDNPVNMQMVVRLLEVGFVYDHVPSNPTSTNRYFFSYSGGFDEPRHSIVKRIRDSGHCEGALGKKTTHFLKGRDASPAKVSKAESMGLPIIDLDAFNQLISIEKQHAE